LTVLMKIYMYYYMQKGGFLMAVVRPLSWYDHCLIVGYYFWRLTDG
jgi:hypothetical protein